MHGAQGLRDVGDSIVLMGKNTMMKRSIRLYCERTGNETWSNLLDSLVGNVGLIFTKADLAEVSLQCYAHGAIPQWCRHCRGPASGLANTAATLCKEGHSLSGVASLFSAVLAISDACAAAAAAG